MSDTLEVNVNGAMHRVQATPDTPLLYVLRNELGLTGPRFGCGLAQCGACTVHLDGAAVRSCVLPTSAAENRRVTTLEGLAASHGGAAAPHKGNIEHRAALHKAGLDAVVSARHASGAGPEAPVPAMHPVQQALVDEQAAQCGYCINGWIMTAAAMLQAKPQVSEAEIRSGLSGLKCRCGAHMSILRAVRRAAKQMA